MRGCATNGSCGPFTDSPSARIFSTCGALPSRPDLVWSIPPGCAVFDLADVDPAPGTELLLLRTDGVRIVSFAGPEPVVRDVLLPDGTTLAANEDERGLDRARLAWFGLGPEPWLILPMPGELIALTPDSEVRARLEVPTRANYLVPPRPGPVFVESELQVLPLVDPDYKENESVPPERAVEASGTMRGKKSC